MAIVAIFSGSYCKGEEIAHRVARHFEYDLIEEELLNEISQRFGISREKLIRMMTGPPPVLNKFTREREKIIAGLKTVLAEMIIQDNQLLFGFAGHLLPGTISHVLKICIIANHDYRVRQVIELEGKSEREAEKIIHKDDKERLQWTQFLFDKTPYEESLYDILIPMHDTSMDEAVDIICDHADREPVKTSVLSQNAAEDFALSARVNLALVEAGHDVGVFSENGFVTLTINKYVVRLKQLENELKRIAGEVSDVKRVYTRIGPKYTPPSIIPMGDLEMPSKILLVDDEKEFVHTLSERLQTRNLESSVVYDGEQALDFVKNDEPEVMVLDLKMPGIDGIEVLRRVKREHPNVEVIILTGHGSEREETLAAELGAFAYLHKPVNIDILAQTMKEAYKKVNEAKRMRQDQESGKREEE